MQRDYKNFKVCYSVNCDENNEKVTNVIMDLKHINSKESYGDKKLFNQMKDTFKLLKEHGFCYYRGQHHSWDLNASLFRYDKQQQSEINNLKSELIRCFPNRFPEDNVGQNYTKSESQFQHFGIPTKLLDVTVNPWIAYYFMFEQNFDDSCYIYTEDAECLIKKTMYALRPKKNIDSILKNLPVDANNPRITAQEGIFLLMQRKVGKKNNKRIVDTELNEYFDIITINIYATNEVGNKVEQLELYKMLVSDQQEQLKLIGYTEAKIYPDFQKVIENNMRRINEMKPF